MTRPAGGFDSDAGERYISCMIAPHPALEEFEARQAREAHIGRSYADALARFTALWVYAREINPALGAEWTEDIEAAIAVGRALNGLSPAA